MELQSTMQNFKYETKAQKFSIANKTSNEPIFDLRKRLIDCRRRVCMKVGCFGCDQTSMGCRCAKTSLNRNFLTQIVKFGIKFEPNRYIFDSTQTVISPTKNKQISYSTGKDCE